MIFCQIYVSLRATSDGVFCLRAAGIVLSLFGGVQKHVTDKNKVPVRGDIHVIIVGMKALCFIRFCHDFDYSWKGLTRKFPFVYNERSLSEALHAIVMIKIQLINGGTLHGLRHSSFAVAFWADSGRSSCDIPVIQSYIIVMVQVIRALERVSFCKLLL